MHEPDLERRFSGLRRLYGDAGYARLRAARVAVVGLGGVGSWAAEALARSGVAALTLIDLDHVSESNINRQVQAMIAFEERTFAGGRFEVNPAVLEFARRVVRQRRDGALVEIRRHDQAGLEQDLEAVADAEDQAFSIAKSP